MLLNMTTATFSVVLTRFVSLYMEEYEMHYKNEQGKGREAGEACKLHTATNLFQTFGNAPDKMSGQYLVSSSDPAG